MRTRISVGMMAVGMVLSGCGGAAGGSGSAVTPPPILTTFSSGNFSGRAASTNPPVTTAGQGTVATGLTGVITQLKLRDQNVTVNDTRMAYASLVTGGGDIYTSNIDGSNPIRLTKTENLAESNPAISPAGNKIACQAFDSTLFRHVYLYRADGLFLGQVKSGPGLQEFDPSWSPDSSKVFFDQTSTGPPTLAQYVLSTGVSTAINTGGSAFQPAMSSQNKLAFASGRNGRVGGNDIFVSNADGSSPVQITTGTDDYTDPVFSPDGDTLYFIDRGASSYSIFASLRYFWGSSSFALYSGSDAIKNLAASPDGHTVAFEDTSTLPNPILSVPVGFNNTSATLMFSPPLDCNGFSWGPMVSDRLIVGTGGLLATTASGFIYADAGGQTQSVLTFGAVTPSSAILHAMTGIGGTEESLVFTVDADTLNSMTYTNAPVWNSVSVIQSGTSTPTANGAIISIGAFDGHVNAVLPFNGSRAVGSRPTVTRSGSAYLFSGSFLGAYGKDGKNVAPTGATTVRLDPKTGALTAS